MSAVKQYCSIIQGSFVRNIIAPTISQNEQLNCSVTLMLYGIPSLLSFKNAIGLNVLGPAFNDSCNEMI